MTDGLEFRKPMLAMMVIIWLGTAIVSLGPGHEWGLRLMAEAGFAGNAAQWAILMGALSDACLGFGLLVRPWRRQVLRLQLLLMAVYMKIITVILPRYWLDPFASVAKNLVMIIATLWLLRTEPVPCTST